MKRTSYPRFLARAAMTLLALFCCLTGARADELTVYEGTTTNNHVPAYVFYFDDFTRSQFVIPADDLSDMAGGEISALKFYTTSSNIPYTSVSTVNVYLMEVNFTTMTALLPTTNIVYQGTLEFVSEGEGGSLTIELQNPYRYGGQNLLIGIDNITDSGYKSIYFYGQTVEGAAWSGSNGNSLDDVTGSVQNFIPKTTFTYTPGTASSCERPTNLVATEIDAHSATLTWESEVGVYLVEYKEASLPNDDENWTSIEEDIERNEFTLTGLEQNTAYNARVRAVCDPEDEENGYSGWRTANFTTADPCGAPTNLVVSDITATTATLSWTAGYEETSWTVKYKKNADEEWTEVVANSPTITLEKLESGTQYNVKVYNCDEEASSVSTSFYTAEVCPDGKVCIGTGTATSNYLPANNYYNYSLTEQIYTAEEIGQAGAILSLDFFKASTIAMVKNLDIYIVSTDKTAFESTSDWITVTASDLVYSGTVNFADNDWTTIELDNPFIYDGNSNICIVVDNNTGTYVSNTPFRVFDASENQALYYQTDGTNLDPTGTISGGYTTAQKNRIRLGIGEPPACPKPTGLAVNYESGTEATISWTSDATAWNISVNGEVTSVTQNPYTLTNLELGTTYEVKVQAVCSETETSDWTNAVSFTTDKCMPEDMCQLTFTLSDSYGDSWNGASIAVYDYTGETMGDLLASLTISSSLGAGVEQTTTLNFCNGQELAIFWSSGSYDDECSYTITDLNGDIVAQNDFELAMAYTIDCTVTDCRRPTDFTASNIGPHSVELSWTENGEATAWVIEYISENDEESTTITVESNPYTLTGLAAETMYAAQVSPVCDDDVVKPSEVISWTTTVAAPAPTDLAANRVNANSATLNWEGPDNANSYNVRYGKVSDDVDSSTPATIILTAPDIWGDGSGYQMLLDANANAYGTIIPETGGLTTSGDASAETYAEFEYKIPTNADGAMNTTNAVVNNSVSIQIPAGTYDWCITNPTPGDRVWIASSNGNVGGRQDDFVFEPGKTYEFTLSLYSTSDGNNDGVDLTTTPLIEWSTPVEGVTSPYQLTDLDPSTEYYWQVQANCGEDGLSQWSSTSTFTTGSYSDAPTELAATATSSTATLEWTGSQDSYNVRYRVTSHGDELAVHNFDESDMGEWTTIDADGDGYDWILATEAAGVYHNAGVDLSGQGHNDSNDFLISGSYSNVFGALTPDNYLVSPQVDLGGSISFYAQAQDDNFPAEHFGVAVSTTGNTDAADFITIKEWTMNADGTGTEGSKAGEWGLFTVDLSDYAGQQGYVAIRHFGCTDQFILNIDDIVIEGPAEAETEWTELTVSDNSVEIDGLESNTEYEWQVRGILDEGTTNWTIGDNFTTLPLIELANDDSNNEKKNSEIIADYDGETVDVTLAGRTLFKDGSWNTICLPFDVELEGSPLEDATAKTLKSATMTGNHVSLTFGEAVTTLEAGVPYIIKWEEGEDISNPTFTGVTIESETKPYDDGVNVKFIGYYDAKPITANDANIYYMTADNTLKYTGVNRTLKACRAYFEFTEAATAGGVREFTLNFGDNDATGIVSIDNEQLNNESGWYTVDGKKLDKQPKRKGVYINNGIKVVIK